VITGVVTTRKVLRKRCEIVEGNSEQSLDRERLGVVENVVDGSFNELLWIEV